MNCPECESTFGTVVKASGFRPELGLVYRRRECLNPDCMNRFTTYEIPVDEDRTRLNCSVGSAILHGREHGKWELRYIL